MKRALLLFFLFLSSPLMAAITHQIDTTLPLHCHFSLQHHNRILIEEGRIKKIIFPEELLYVRLEEVSGQVFIQAKRPLSDPVLISIITQKGLVQDLHVTFCEQPSQVILLRSCSPEEREQTPHQTSQKNTSLNGVITSILNGECPYGFQALPIRKCQWSPKRGIRAKLVGKLTNQQEELSIFLVSNRSFRSLSICEQEFVRPGIQWVYLDQHCLKSKEQTLAILTRCHE